MVTVNDELEDYLKKKKTKKTKSALETTKKEQSIENKHKRTTSTIKKSLRINKKNYVFELVTNMEMDNGKYFFYFFILIYPK